MDGVDGSKHIKTESLAFRDLISICGRIIIEVALMTIRPKPLLAITA